mgnify:CR=1 FL=1
MKDTKRLLEARKTQKKRKPNFIRQDAHKKPKLDERWRRPKGSDSKMRLAKKGYRKTVSVGYRSPAGVRGLTGSGLTRVHVARITDLSSIDPKEQCAVIVSGTGMKKRMEILEEAIAKNIKVYNYKDPKVTLDSMKETLEKKKEQKKKAEEVKKEKEKQKQEESKKKEEEQKEEQKKQDESLEDVTEKEDAKEKEKKEKDKVLTKKS